MSDHHAGDTVYDCVFCATGVSGNLRHFAGRGLESGAVEDFDLAMGIVNQGRLPESPERHGNARPPRPQHHRKQLVTERHDVVVDAVSRHEQPARQPLLNRMAPVARRRLR